MTEAFVNENVPHRGFQGGTLVVPARRGRRLGMAVKVANQRALAERFPEWRGSSPAMPTSTCT